MSNSEKTTSVFAKVEFWMTVVTSVSGLLLAFGVITPEQNEGLAKYAPNLIGAILSLLSTFKFIGTQHAARVEVFRAMCAMSLEKAALGSGGKASAQAAESVVDETARLAKAAGL